MEKFLLKSVYFKKLKGLNDVTIKFSDTLTSIMGVNGSGKTTVIHALACIYQPDEKGKGENHKFPEFFVPNTDAPWTGSELSVVNENEVKKGERSILPSRRYGKDFDRWSPRYENRPKRNVYYIGIDTCLPEIEKNTSTSRVDYSTLQVEGKVANETINLASYVLNKPYAELLDNIYKNKHFSGVVLDTGLRYSSLSMGTGEQRILKILDKVLNAEAYSLILIDEIDLLLHVSALHRLIIELHEIAEKRHLQIVLTTHSTEMMQLTEYVLIQCISNVSNQEQTYVYEKISSDLYFSLTGKTVRPLKVYVEDRLAASIVKEIAKEKAMLSSVEIITYGAVENAFTLAATFAIERDGVDKKLIVLDGDRYLSQCDKEKQIQKKLTGTEDDAETKQRQALSMITQFNLPEDTPPEKFFHEVILRYAPKESELYYAANEINAVKDTHQWLHTICEKIGLSEEDIVRDIFKYASKSEEMQKYIYNISAWLTSKKETGI